MIFYAPDLVGVHEKFVNLWAAIDDMVARPFPYFSIIEEMLVEDVTKI